VARGGGGAANRPKGDDEAKRRAKRVRRQKDDQGVGDGVAEWSWRGWRDRSELGGVGNIEWERSERYVCVWLRRWFASKAV
jgi:hypothetical protein